MTITIVNHPSGVVRIVETSRYRLAQAAVADCDRCATDGYVKHYSCMYAGKAPGHSVAHCTANGCY